MIYQCHDRFQILPLFLSSGLTINKYCLHLIILDLASLKLIVSILVKQS